MATIDRFLIVDDVEANILFFQVLLEKIGKKQVFTATTGDEGQEIVEKEKIQFIISAWELAGMPGTVFIQRVRSERKRKNVKFLIFSKRMEDNDIQLAKDFGLDNILGMPFDKTGAEELLRSMIEAEESITPLEQKIRKIEEFVAAGKPTEALKLFGPSVTKKSPFRTRVKSVLADIWLVIGQYRKCEMVLEEVFKEDAEFPAALEVKSKLLMAQGKPEEAIALLESMVQKSPHNIGNMLSLGSSYVSAERYEDARGVFDKVSSMDTDNPDLKDENIKFAFASGDMPLAAQLVAETENGDDLARHFNNMAIAHTGCENFEKAIEIYQNALQLLADKAKLHLLTYNLGLAYRKSGSLEKAFITLCESYILQPSFEKAYASLARVSKELKSDGKSLDMELIKKVKEARSTVKSA